MQIRQPAVPRAPRLRAAASLLAVPVLLAFAGARPLRAQEGPGAVLIEADAAWIEPGSVIEPAWILVRDGRQVWVGRRPPQEARNARRVRWEGTVAPALVDAWSGLLPADLAAARDSRPYLAVRDALPADLPGADPELAARARAQRAAGVSAVWLGLPRSGLHRGRGTAAVLGAADLPVAAGREALEFQLGGRSDVSGKRLADAERFAALLEQALDYRDQREELPEKLEKYAQDLEDWKKKLEEYAGRKKELEEKGDSEGLKKLKEPQRPARPQPPARNPWFEQVLRGLDGELAFRVEANDLYDLRRLLEIREEHDLELVVVGGREADLLAEELAEAEVPVVLPVAANALPPAQEGRSLVERYRRLVEAGVEVALASGGSGTGAGLLLIRAGELVAGGADPEAVWASLTTIPARLLGLEEGHGRLGRGRAGDLLLFQGRSPFDASRPFRVHTATQGWKP